MELATIFLIWLAITVIENLAKRKKRRLPPPERQPDFDIPTLANDPNLPGEEVPIFVELPSPAEVRPLNAQPPRPSAKKFSEPVREEPATEFPLNLTPTTVLNAFVLTELLDKPKALRRRNFSRR